MLETEASKPSFSPSRQLVVHVMLSLLVSSAVFVVVAWGVVVPQLAKQEVKIRALETQVTALQEQMAEEGETAEAGPAAAGAQAAVPAPAAAGQAAPAAAQPSAAK
jgi:hypothetical protein